MGSIVLYLGSTLNKGMIRAEKAVLTGTRFGHSGAPELPRYRMQTEKSINGKFSEPRGGAKDLTARSSEHTLSSKIDRQLL